MLGIDTTMEEAREAIQAQLHGPDRAVLQKVVRQALASRCVERVHWRVEVVGGSMGHATAGVYRVMGNALDRVQGSQLEIPWSIILKVISVRTPDAQSIFRDEAHPLYWKREAVAYRSGLLDDLPGGLSTPRCYAVVDKNPGTIWLWLEDVKDAHASGWTLEQYALAAECLGRFNGAYLVERPMPTYSWLVRDGSPRGLLDHNPETRDLIADPRTWQHPMVHSLFPIPVADRLLRLWDEREMLLRPLDQVQHTFCHLDAWRGNMFARAAPEGARNAKGPYGLVLIDWAFPGRAAIGTDAGDLFAASFSLSELSDMEPLLLDHAIFESYIAGLQDAGWEGDARAVRIAFAALSALKYGCFALSCWLRDLPDEHKQTRWERLSNLAFSDYTHQQARLVYYLLDLADEARMLLDSRSGPYIPGSKAILPGTPPT